MMDSLVLLDAHEAQKRIAAGAASAEQYVLSCLKQIEARDPIVEAWEQLDPKKSLRHAQRLDSCRTQGPLHGLPIGIKDIFETRDFPTAYGSRLYSRWQPARDAACVALLRAAGGIILGKTVTTEFAYLTPGKTTNPHNDRHTPGGSSSGSAAAVADHMVPLAVGTQTAGSIIRPAAFCGVVGYKPTFGLINRSGVLTFSESLDTVGVFARRVSDAALLASVMANRQALRKTGDLAIPPRIGVCPTHEWDRASLDTRHALERAASSLARAGGDIKPFNLPQGFSDILDVHATIMAFEASRSFSHELLHYRDQISPQFLRLLMEGRRCSSSVYDLAFKKAESYRVQLSSALEDEGIDILVAPSTVGEAPEGIRTTGEPLFDKIWTVLHVPCLHIPSGFGVRGLPVGIQLVAPRGEDERLLRIAEWVERHLTIRSGARSSSLRAGAP